MHATHILAGSVYPNINLISKGFTLSTPLSPVQVWKSAFCQQWLGYDVWSKIPHCKHFTRTPQLCGKRYAYITIFGWFYSVFHCLYRLRILSQPFHYCKVIRDFPVVSRSTCVILWYWGCFEIGRGDLVCTWPRSFGIHGFYLYTTLILPCYPMTVCFPLLTLIMFCFILLNPVANKDLMRLYPGILVLLETPRSSWKRNTKQHTPGQKVHNTKQHTPGQKVHNTKQHTPGQKVQRHVWRVCYGGLVQNLRREKKKIQKKI